jgi:uncharacterized membrane protein
MPGNTIGRQAAAMNVGTFERIGSTLMGTALISRALGRPSLGRLVMAIGGAALLQRGLTGHCAAYQRLGVSTALREEPEPDAVDCASEDSFPASDPPSWTPVVGPAARN